MKTGVERVGLGLLILLGIAAGLALFLLGMEWRPDPMFETPVRPPAAPEKPVSTPANNLSVISWNLGYAALSREADFFWDGGVQVQAANEPRVRSNLAGILGFLQAHPSDLLLLQEVDSDSKRSWHVNEVEFFLAGFPALFSSRALNYRSPYVPLPLASPMGQVESGLLALSRYPIHSSRRLQLPGRFPWPVRVFHLKRCVHELRLVGPGGRDWVLLHLHLTTFDKDGAIRRQEMAFLRAHMLKLAQAGDRVIVGGDWNQALPGLKAGSFPSRSATPDWFQVLPPDWTPPGWSWAFDPTTPSLRATDRPYQPGENFLTAVDGFLIGPGVELISVKTHDLGFEYSDHNPVTLEVRTTK